MDYIIRPMSQEDWSEVLEIYYQGIQTNMATYETQCPSFEYWNEAHMSACRLVVEWDCEVVAFAALSLVSHKPMYSGVAELEIYVDCGHRNKGVGAMLLKALLKESENQGVWLVESNILEENLPCLKLHESCGFRRVGYRERPAKDRFGVWRNLVVMEHRIQSDKGGGCDCYMAKTGTPEPGSVFARLNEEKNGQKLS